MDKMASKRYPVKFVLKIQKLLAQLCQNCSLKYNTIPLKSCMYSIVYIASVAIAVIVILWKEKIRYNYISNFIEYIHGMVGSLSEKREAEFRCIFGQQNFHVT